MIRNAGGEEKFLELLGMRVMNRHLWRIRNWRARGIPPESILEYYEQLKPLYERVAPKVREPKALADDTAQASVDDGQERLTA